MRGVMCLERSIMKKIIIPVFIVFSLFSCQFDKNPTAVDDSSKEGSFSIYFLADTNLTTYQAMNLDINQLVLKDSSWMTEADIDFYDFSTHCIYLKNDKSKYFNEYCGLSFQFDPVLIDRPFVVIADSLRCYVGGLYSSLHSMLSSVPHFDELDVGFYPSDVFHLSPGVALGADKRDDVLIQQVFKNLDKYSSGLDCELKNVRIIDNSDTSTVDYTFTLKNTDKANLYVLDPDKMGSSLFHYFTNGVTFRSETEHTLIQSTYKTTESPDPFYTWNFNWFSLIKSGKSITRTVQLRGYPNIPEDTYICSFTFSNPNLIEKEDRNRESGRIWLGIINSDYMSVEVM